MHAGKDKFLDRPIYITYFECLVETSVDPSATSPRYPRLRPGPGLSREVVAAHQQARLHQAMIEIVAAHGYEGVTVRGLAKRARISSGTFYRYYSSTEDCLLCAYDEICSSASRRMTEAAGNESDPQRRLTAAISRLYRDMVAAPQATVFMLRGAPTVGPAFTNDLRSTAMQVGAALESCLCSDGDLPVDPLLIEGIIAGVARIGGTLRPAASGAEIREATAEAVEWVASLRTARLPEAEPTLAAGSAEQGGSSPVSDWLPDDRWRGSLGDKRAMILAATFRIARAGYHQLSISRICCEAGVSHRDFDRHFESLEDVFASALEERAAGAIDEAVRGHDGSVSWSRTIYSALHALCEAIDTARDIACIFFVEVTAAGTQGIDSRDRLISLGAQALRTIAREGQDTSERAGEASAAAVWAILRRQVQDRGAGTSELLPVLALLMLAPGDRKRSTGLGNTQLGMGNPIAYCLKNHERLKRLRRSTT